MIYDSQLQECKQVVGIADLSDKECTLTLPVFNFKYLFADPLTGKVRSTYWLLRIGLSIFFLLFWVVYILPAFRDFEHLNFFNRLLGLVYTVGSVIPLCLLNDLLSTQKVLTFNKDYLSSKVHFAFAGRQLFASSCFENGYRWSDLKCVRYFHENEGWLLADRRIGNPGERLVLDWKAKNLRWFAYRPQTTYFNLPFMSAEAKELLFCALAQRVSQELLTPEVLYLQVQALSGNVDSGLASYTQVWFEEFNRNFELSNNVTLASGAKCGNGRFVVMMTLAIRFNSVTYLAADALGRKVIVKELVVPLDSGEQVQQKLLEQFNREAEILAKLEHPLIVKVIDHFIENNRSYIVMALAEGRNLREWLRTNGILQEVAVVKIGLQLTSVLCYLHHHSPAIIHRDFTPDNMVYAPDGSVKVIDFGAANLYNTGKTATLIGKQNYMAPEQLRGKPSPASDIYALGATLGFLLTGDDLPSMGKLPDFDKALVSNELVSIIRKCTSFEAEDRPSCDELLRLLKGLDNVNV